MRRGPRTAAAAGPRASRSEWEVAELLRRGHDTREIADMLVIELVTVRSHVSAITHKLGVSTREEAMRALEPDGSGERVRAAG